MKRGVIRTELEYICYAGRIEDDNYENSIRVGCVWFDYYRDLEQIGFDFSLEGKDEIYYWLQKNLPDDRGKVSAFGRMVSCKNSSNVVCFEE